MVESAFKKTDWIVFYAYKYKSSEKSSDECIWFYNDVWKIP